MRQPLSVDQGWVVVVVVGHDDEGGGVREGDPLV